MSRVVRPLRDDRDLAAARVRVDELLDAETGTPESDELAVLATLVEAYERSRFPIPDPTPVEAIVFRMSQRGMQPRDLEPIIGTRARVSQVLNGARPLSIDMIRAVHRHLDIPAEILISDGGRRAAASLSRPDGDLLRPAATLLRKWGELGASEGLSSLLSRAFPHGSAAAAAYRKTRTPRTNAKTNAAALAAWCAVVVLRSRSVSVSPGFDPAAVEAALRGIARLSALPDGPASAVRALADLGVVMLHVPHLPETYLDGAAMIRDDGVPVVAVTIRRDRIDNFWFTLIHECVHVARHLEAGDAILDDLEIGSDDAIEDEADREACDALIPPELWRKGDPGPYASMARIEELAGRAGVHPAIVAGRWQKENRDYRRFSKMLGHGTVRLAFDRTMPPSAIARGSRTVPDGG